MTLTTYLIFATIMFVALLVHYKLAYHRKYTVGDLVIMLGLAYFPVLNLIVLLLGFVHIVECFSNYITETKFWNKDLF